MTRTIYCAVALLCFIATPVSGAEVEWLEVKRKDGHIDIRSEIVIDAPSPSVYDALLEYDKFAEVNDSFTESRYLDPAPDGAPRIYTKIEGCIWFFCKTVERYARLELIPRWQITAIAEPEKSDAKSSVERWTLIAKEETTIIDYHHEIETGFWVPPLIGVWVIRGTIKRSTIEAAERIEQMANDSLTKDNATTQVVY